MTESRLREDICRFAKSLYDRGLTHGSTGNISARTPDGRFLVTPTGSSFGFLDPARLTLLDGNGVHISGDPPTKEMPLHAAFYETRMEEAGAVVHLHSHHAVAWSMMPEVDPDDALPPLTPYATMQLGKVALLPYARPGDPVLGDLVRGLGGRRAAAILANHGPVVAARALDRAVWAMEELEAAARLALDLRDRPARRLTPEQVAELTPR